VHVVDDGGAPVAALYGYLGETTNNVAEYAALLALLEHAATLRPARLVVRSDSQLLIRQMRGEYKVKDARLKLLHAAAGRLASRVASIAWEHVPREQNRDADALANQAMDERAGNVPVPAAVAGLAGPATNVRLPGL
jgi:ribonuclease HI